MIMLHVRPYTHIYVYIYLYELQIWNWYTTDSVLLTNKHLYY